MRYATLGSTGVKVSCIGLGTATFGVAPLAEEAGRMIGRALDLGINLVDTANSYGNQARFDRAGAPPAAARESAEEIVGRAIGARRHEVVLCSKVMEPVGAGSNERGLSRRHIFDQVETSLRRLGTDHLDLYYAHHPDPATPLEQTLRAFDDLVRQGKIRYSALSTYPAWQMTEALWTADRRGFAPPVCNQIAYNLANRAAELEMLPACRQFGVGVTVFSPLAGGLLAGPAVRQRPVAGGLRWGASGFSGRQVALAERLEAQAAESGQSPAVLALAWLVSRPAISAALIGPETITELEANAAAGAVDLTPDLLARVDSIGQAQ
jgi:aryl-alcohol dehydrogenase-like predicted oxidoreductase